MIKKRLNLSQEAGNVDINDIDHRLKAYKMGDISLTVATIILVVICLFFERQFAPFIVLLMSSRIGTSVYMVIKDFSKKECSKLIVWCALFVKSVFTCWQFLIL